MASPHDPPSRHSAHRRYLAACASIFAVVFVLLAIDPLYRADWALENALVLVFVLGMWASWRWFTFSRVSITLILAFLCLHEIGAHYTYSRVPYDAWFQSLTGHSLNGLLGFERNHFDRLAHLSYGLLLAYPIREIVLRVVHVRGFWGYFLPLDMTMSTSMTFELIEWGAATLFGGDLGMAYLGTQGDEWDSHRDMALASLGALIAMGITLAVNLALQRDFANEWAESLRVKDQEPLGESALERMLDGERD